MKTLIIVLAVVAMATGSPAPSPDPSPKPSLIHVLDGQDNRYREAWPVDAYTYSYNQWDSAPWDETLYAVQLAPNAAASTSEVTKTTTVVNHPSVHSSVRPSVLPGRPAVIRPWPSTPQYLPSTSTSSASAVASASSASNAGGIVPTNAPGYYPIGTSTSSAAAAASVGLSSNAPGTMIAMNTPAKRWGNVYYPNQGYSQIYSLRKRRAA